MGQLPISVIIPTFNRAQRLAITLDALGESDVDFQRLEVIIVDDGSSDKTADIQSNVYPFLLRYLKQPNQGDGIARNEGARASRGELLVFLDDDISVTPDLLTLLTETHAGRAGVIVLGTLLPDHLPESGRRECPIISDGPASSEPVPFTECRSGIMAISRRDFMGLGMMQPLEIDGSSIWCDIEFAYRADLAGFLFVKSMKAVGHHHDYTQRNLKTKSRRMHRVARASILLFQRHPQLKKSLPMFHDTTPIVWRKDSAKLIARKFARSLLSTKLTIRLLETLHTAVSGSGPWSVGSAALERWVRGGYIYRGYRQGLREFGPINLDD